MTALDAIHRPPVPRDVYRAAVRCWFGTETDDEFNRVMSWGWGRWPGVPLPKNPETLGLWVLSISYQDGREDWQ